MNKLSALQLCFTVLFGALCFYMGRADSLAKKLEEEIRNQHRPAKLQLEDNHNSGSYEKKIFCDILQISD